jgi:hypothetical protein
LIVTDQKSKPELLQAAVQYVRELKKKLKQPQYVASVRRSSGGSEEATFRHAHGATDLTYVCSEALLS